MDLPRLLPFACAALIALPALHAHAQAPKRQFGEADIATRNMADACAAIWSIKDRQEVRDVESSIKAHVNSTIASYAQARQQAAEAAARLEQELNEANNRLAVLSFAEATMAEEALDAGMFSAEQVKAKVARVLRSEARTTRDVTEARLETARGVLNGINRRMIGWYAYGIGTLECARDQTAYLDKTNPNSPLRGPDQPRPLPPSTNTANIQKGQGTLSGSWRGTCRYSDVNNIPVNGRFSMNIDAQRNISAAFVDGTAATVKGAMQPNGVVNATGNVAMAPDLVVFVNMIGQMSWAPDGSLRGAGRFTSSNTGLQCDGTWAGG